MPQPWKRPWGGTGAPGFDTWLDRDFWWFVNQAKGLHDRNDWHKIAAEGVYSEATARLLADPSWITYTEEHASDVTEPEWEVFQDEWRADWPWTKPRNEIAGEQQPANNFNCGHQAFPDSYLDFCLYYHNEWFQRGVGVYFDNTMPYTMYNPLLSDAYYGGRRSHPTGLLHLGAAEVLPTRLAVDERVAAQRRARIHWPSPSTSPTPCCCPGAPGTPSTWTSNGTGSPIRPTPPQGRKRLNEPFPPDLLLAETAGRQTGSMGNSHFGILGNPNQAASFPPTYARSEWGMRIVHEIGNRSNNALEKALWKFGYGTDRTTIDELLVRRSSDHRK